MRHHALVGVLVAVALGGAVEILGLRPSTLRDRMKALGIHRPD